MNMNDWEDFTQKTFYLFVGGVSLGIEQTGKILQDLGEQTQNLADELQKQAAELSQNFSEGFSQTATSNRPSEKVRQKLLTILNGNLVTAERLVENERRKNPGHAADWYWEKVIYDLERDRQG